MEKKKLARKLTLSKETLRFLQQEDELRQVVGGSNPTAWTQCRACLTDESSCCTQTC